MSLDLHEFAEMESSR
jgi:hypothetical protein